MGPGGYGHMGAYPVQAAFRKALTEAKINDFRFHDLRHTFGTRLGDAGVSPFIIAELMGHSNIQMTARYTHPTEGGKRAAVERAKAPTEEMGTFWSQGASEQVRRPALSC